MNYKIDYNFLEITNSPSIEYYFEKRAREGWLIHQIYLGSIFIFKKIEPIELDFSIKPYPLESDAWHYVMESYDLHIYYKKYKAEVAPLKIEPEEEFEILEAIGKKRMQGNAMQALLFFVVAWFNVGGIYTSPDFLKDGVVQLILPLMLVGLTIAIWGIIHVRRFLKTNRENIAAGKAIEYSDSMFLVPSTTFFLGTILLVASILHFLYLGIVARSFIPFIFLLGFISVLILERVLYFWKQKDRTSEVQKNMISSGAVLLGLLVIIGFGVYKEIGLSKNPDLKEYKVLTVDTFPEGELEMEGTLSHNMSLIIPKSYEYYYISDQSEYVMTEYSRSLVTDLAKDLVVRYLDEKKKETSDFYLDDIKLYFEEDIFNDRLAIAGISEGDLIRLKNLQQKDAEETALQLIKERSISEADANAWNADDVHFLSYNKNEILIRKGNEVFYLLGKDFTDPDVIRRTKDKLELK